MLMTHEKISQKVRELISFSMTIPVESVTETADLDTDLNIGSLDKVHIFILVEDEFHITIQDDDMNDIETVEDIVELVVRKIES